MSDLSAQQEARHDHYTVHSYSLLFRATDRRIDKPAPISESDL